LGDEAVADRERGVAGGRTVDCGLKQLSRHAGIE
jgi:hypothetical protein